MRKSMVRAGMALVAVIAALAIAWATAPDPRFNQASFEDSALVPVLAPLGLATTLAQVQDADGKVSTLLVTRFDEDRIAAIDLSAQLDLHGTDPFAVVARLSAEELARLAANDAISQDYAISDLLPAAPLGDRQIGTGTNFPEHAAEASSASVFQFPKFGRAGPARTRVRAVADVLLDYEAELCMRFDRDVTSLEDFDRAVKGVFLCGDFTDRTKLLRLVDIDNFDSGRGFSDSKSRADFFPAGPFLVIPRDWKSFIAAERFTTRVNGEPRQDARGGEMTLGFHELAQKALGDMANPRFLYAGRYHHLAPNRRIDADMSLMSGTAEGVIFTQPTRADLIEGALAYLLSGKWLTLDAPAGEIVETFIDNELASGHFLQPGDLVEHRSAHLGTIEVEVSE